MPKITGKRATLSTPSPVASAEVIPLPGHGPVEEGAQPKMQRKPKRVTDVDVHIAGRVRLRRHTLGMSQERLAEIVGVTFQQVQKYENAGNRIGGGRLYNIAAALRVPVGYFYEGLPDTIDGPTIHLSVGEGDLLRFLGTTEGRKLNKSFAKFGNGRVQRAFAALADAIAKDGENE
jgi:transcriptional regulator with XRE-family HTH domain